MRQCPNHSNEFTSRPRNHGIAQQHRKGQRCSRGTLATTTRWWVQVDVHSTTIAPGRRLWVFRRQQDDDHISTRHEQPNTTTELDTQAQAVTSLRLLALVASRSAPSWTATDGTSSEWVPQRLYACSRLSMRSPVRYHGRGLGQELQMDVAPALSALLHGGQRRLEGCLRTAMLVQYRQILEVSRKRGSWTS